MGRFIFAVFVLFCHSLLAVKVEQSLNKNDEQFSKCIKICNDELVWCAGPFFNSSAIVSKDWVEARKNHIFSEKQVSIQSSDRITIESKFVDSYRVSKFKKNGEIVLSKDASSDGDLVLKRSAKGECNDRYRRCYGACKKD